MAAKKKTKKKSSTAVRSKAGGRSSSRAPSKALPHDTPVDTPAVTAGAVEALARLRGMETLEEAYDAYLSLKLEHAAAAASLAERMKRLDDQGQFLVGAVRAASDEPSAPKGAAGLAKASGLSSYLSDAEAKLSAARDELSAEGRASEEKYAAAFAALEAELHGRVERYQKKLLPAVTLYLRPAGSRGRILHAARVGRDESVVLFFVLTGKLPTRFGFLFDDSTDDVTREPPSLYPDEGVVDVRAKAPALEALLLRDRGFVPYKGFLPVRLPRADGGFDFFRLLSRGPVMEAEVRDGDGFRSFLTHEESERLAGHLLKLKLAGRISLDVKAE